MRTKNLILFILVIFMVLPGMVLAEEHNFPAGSLIVPMDSFYQPEAGGGILEAYGLIYKLLSHQDQQCIAGCGDDQGCRDKCEHDISVYWVINDQKTTINGVDLTIKVSDENLTEEGIKAVVRHFKNAGDTAATFVFNSDNGDDPKKISYSGSVFILDVYELTDEVVTYAKDLINSSEWSAVKVHEALVPFAAPIHRKMRGTPPKIALMNNTEDKTKGNAAILESYLRLAGVCTDVYEVVTPNEIAGIAPDGSSVSSKLRTGGFDFLWAPHWEGMDQYSGDLNSNGSPDVDDIVKEIRLFLESGRALLAECASIETFEHNIHGHFLTDKGFGHNGGTNDEDTIIYNWVTAANSQIGDFKYVPEGGHLHNWRPLHAGDPYNFDDLPVLDGVDSVYNPTVKRFTIDTTGWDYYVGGHAFGNTDFGYVVYLGGHKYAACSGPSATHPEPNNHLVDLEFDKKISDEGFTLTIDYAMGGT
ncbi:MAG: hypothetical protein JRD84_10080, partial [Deltaproteobacteria bacterium]|nr:hypothetical protein [Deltaproteobacteria bacterium]